MATIFVPAKEWLADQAEIAKKRAEEEARKAREKGAQLIVNATNKAQETADAAAAAKDATVDTLVNAAFDKVREGGEVFDNLGTAVHDKFQPPGTPAGPENQPVAPEPTPQPTPTPTPTPQPTALPPAASPVTRRPEPPVSNVGPVIERGQPTPVTPTLEPTPTPEEEPDPTQQAQWGAQPAGFEPTPPEELTPPDQQQTTPVAPAPGEPPPPPPPVAPTPPTDTPKQFLGNLGGAIGDKFSGLGTATRGLADQAGSTVAAAGEARDEALQRPTSSLFQPPQAQAAPPPPPPSTAVDGEVPPEEEVPVPAPSFNVPGSPASRVKPAVDEALSDIPGKIGAVRQGIGNTVDPALERVSPLVAPEGPLKGTALDLNIPGAPNYRRAAEAGLNTLKQTSESTQENLHGIEGAINTANDPDATEHEKAGARAGGIARGLGIVGDVVAAPYRAGGGAAMGQYSEDKPIEAATQAGVRPDTPVLGGLSNPVELGRFGGDIAAPDTLIDNAVGMLAEGGMAITRSGVMGTLKAIDRFAPDAVSEAVKGGAGEVARLVRAVGDRSNEVVRSIGVPATERQAGLMGGRTDGIPQPAAAILPSSSASIPSEPGYRYRSLGEGAMDLMNDPQTGYFAKGAPTTREPVLAAADEGPPGGPRNERRGVVRLPESAVDPQTGNLTRNVTADEIEVRADDGTWHPVKGFTERPDYGIPTREQDGGLSAQGEGGPPRPPTGPVLGGADRAYLAEQGLNPDDMSGREVTDALRPRDEAAYEAWKLGRERREYVESLGGDLARSFEGENTVELGKLTEEEWNNLIESRLPRPGSGPGWDRPPRGAAPMEPGDEVRAADEAEQAMRDARHSDFERQADLELEDMPPDERLNHIFRQQERSDITPRERGLWRLREAEERDIWNMDLEDADPEEVGSWPEEEWRRYVEGRAEPPLTPEQLRAENNILDINQEVMRASDEGVPIGSARRSAAEEAGLFLDEFTDRQLEEMDLQEFSRLLRERQSKPLTDDEVQALNNLGYDIPDPANPTAPRTTSTAGDEDYLPGEIERGKARKEEARQAGIGVNQFHDGELGQLDEVGWREFVQDHLNELENGETAQNILATADELVDTEGMDRVQAIRDAAERYGYDRDLGGIGDHELVDMTDQEFRDHLDELNPAPSPDEGFDVPPGLQGPGLADGADEGGRLREAQRSILEEQANQAGVDSGFMQRIDDGEFDTHTPEEFSREIRDHLSSQGEDPLSGTRELSGEDLLPPTNEGPPVDGQIGPPDHPFGGLDAGRQNLTQPTPFKLGAKLSDFRNKAGSLEVQRFWDDVIQNAYNNTVYGGIAGGVAGGTTGDPNQTPEQRAARIVAGMALGGGIGAGGSIGGSYTLARLVDSGVVDARVLIPHPDTVDRAKAVMFALADAAKPGEMIEVPRSLRGLQEGERLMRGLPTMHDPDTRALREFFGPNFGIESKEAWLEKLKDWPATRAKKAIRDVIFDTLTGYKPDQIHTGSRMRAGEGRADLLAAQADKAIRGIVPQQDIRDVSGLRATVAQLADAMGIDMPKVTITTEPSWDASFMHAGGMDNPTGSLKISQYMLDRLPEDTVIGILAHELGHGKEDSMRVAAGGLSAYQMWERANQIADTNPLLRPFAGGGRVSDVPNTLTRDPKIEQPRAHIIPPEGQGPGGEDVLPPGKLVNAETGGGIGPERAEPIQDRDIPSVGPVPEHGKAGRLTSLGDLDDFENYLKVQREVHEGRQITGEEFGELQRAMARHNRGNIQEGIQGVPAEREAERLRQAQRRAEGIEPIDTSASDRARERVRTGRQRAAKARTDEQAAESDITRATTGDERAAARQRRAEARARRQEAENETADAEDEIAEVEQTTTEGQRRLASRGQEPLDLPQMEGTGAQMPLTRTGDTPETAQATDAMDEARRIREQSAAAETSRVEGERGGRIEERFADSEAGRQQYEALVQEHGEAAARAIWKQRYGSDVQTSFLPEVRETSSPRGLVEAPTPPPKGTADLDKPIKTEPGYVPDESLPAGQQSLDLDPLSQGTRRMQGTGPGQREPVAGTQRGLDTQKPPTPEEQQASDVQKMQEEATRSKRQAEAAVRQEGEATSEGVRTTEALDRQADLDAQRAEYEALVRQRGETIAKERMADKYPETWGTDPARQLDLVRGNRTEVSRQAKEGLGGAPGPSTGEQGLARDAAQTRLSNAVDARVKADRALYGDPNNPETSARAKMSEAQRAAAQAERRSLAIDNGDQAGDPAEANAAMLAARQKAKEARQAHQQAVTNLRLAEREVKDATRAVGTTNSPGAVEPPEGMQPLLTKGKAGKRNQPLKAPDDPDKVRVRDWIQSSRYSGMLSGVAGMVSDASSGILEQAWKLSADTIRDLAGAATLRGGKPSAAAAEAMYMLHTAITQSMPAFMHEVTHPLRSGNAAESAISKATKAHDRAVQRALEKRSGIDAATALADARAAGEIPAADAGVGFLDRLFSNRKPTADEGQSEVGRDIYRRLKQQNQHRLLQIAGGTLEVPSRVRSGSDAVHNQVGYRGDLAHQGAYRASQEGLQPFSREWFQSINKFIDNARDTSVEKLKFGQTDVPMETAAQRAQKAANEISFRGDPGDIGRLLTRMGSQPALNYLMPLVRTAYIINKKAIERTPVTGAPLLAAEALLRGGAWRGENLAERTLQLGMGGAMWSGMVAMANNGLITGSGPKDSETRQVMMAQGWRPYSVKIGDRYYNYSRIQPMAFPLASAAALAEAHQYADADQDEATVMGDAVNNFVLWGRDQTFLRSFGELYEAMGPQVAEQNGLNQGLARTGANLVMGIGGPLTGSLTGGISSAMDPYERDREDFGDQFDYRLPNRRQSLPVRKDIFGQPVENPGRGLGFISPWQAGPSMNQMNPALRDMRKYTGSQSAIEDHRITDAINAVEEYNSGGKINPTPQERRLYNRFIGRENIKYAEVVKTAREQAAREKAARR